MTATTAAAQILADETWIVDRFGEVGARQIKKLRGLVSKEAGR